MKRKITQTTEAKSSPVGVDWLMIAVARKAVKQQKQRNETPISDGEPLVDLVSHIRSRSIFPKVWETQKQIRNS